MPLIYAAVIFDLDGLLIDTEATSVEVGIETLAGFGHQVERDFLLTMIGVDEDECAAILRAHLGETLDYQQFDSSWRKACRQRHAKPWDCRRFLRFLAISWTSFQFCPGCRRELTRGRGSHILTPEP